MIFAFPTDDRKILESTPEEREAALAEHGFSACRIWTDTANDLDANEMAVELFREMIRRTVQRPRDRRGAVAAGLPARLQATGARHELLRDVQPRQRLARRPPQRPHRRGHADRHPHRRQGFVELDVIVLATGFDAMTGALTRIDVRGRDGRLLRDDWADGPRTYLGVGIVGYPNLFVCVGPGSPGVLATYPPADRAAGRLDRRLRAVPRRARLHPRRGRRDAQEAWCDHVNEVAEGTMFTAASCNSWYNGQNIEGKPRVFLPYVGGLPAYMARCNEVAAHGYEGFVLS